MASASSSRNSSPSLQRRRRRSSTADSQPLSHQEYTYALPDTSISEWLKCPICLNPFVDPIQASACEHIFCKGCINLHLSSSSPPPPQPLDESTCSTNSHCPSCRSPTSLKDLKPAAALIRNMVDSLLVKCPHEKRGCLHTCERSFVNVHARRDCGWAYMGEYSEQPSSTRRSSRGRCECGKKVLRKDWQAHLEDGQCSVVRVRCRYADGENGCGQVLKESEMEEHVVNCPAQPTLCCHCTLELPRGQMKLHQDTCDKAIISCKLERFGCDWKGTRGQYDPQHLSDCRLLPLEAYLIKQEKDVALLQGENARLAQGMETLKQEQERMRALVQQCISCLGSTYIDSNVASFAEEEAAISSYPVDFVPSSVYQERSLSTEMIPSQGRSATALDISAAMPTRSNFDAGFDHTDHFHHLASTSAPASRADFAWQWPDPNTHYRPAPLPSSLATVSDSLTEVNKKLSTVFEQLNQFDRKMEDNHVLGLNANFEANRAHEELNSVRHGLHALRISLLMQQQRSMPGNAFMPGQGLGDNRAGDNAAPNGVGSPNAMPFANGLGPSMMGLRRFWSGYEQTKL